MPLLSNRLNFTPKNPYRKVRPTTSKIIFISCEGAITEEEYFKMVSEIFSVVKSKVQFISVREDINRTPCKFRNNEQISELGKSQPYQLVEKIDTFKQKKESVFDFKNHSEDEFWIVADVDNHTDINHIKKWTSTLKECEEKGYGYAISNPFFEVWLLLHHVDVNEYDYEYAVTENHPYEKTSHYRERLHDVAKAPLKDKKHISAEYYNEEKVRQAIIRAKALHTDKNEKWPHNLGSTVYLLLEKIVEMI